MISTRQAARAVVMAARPPIYLDNQATTPLDPRVLAAMMPYLTTEFGNAASRNHSFGRRAAAAVAEARKHVARLIGAREDEIIFTSGATESDNLAIKGILNARLDARDHIVTTTIEHNAVLDVCKYLERLREDLSSRPCGQPEQVQAGPSSASAEVVRRVGETVAGARVSYVPVTRDGLVQSASIEAALEDTTALVSVMLANNEIGTIQPIEEIGGICRARSVLFHCDAAQGVGKIPFDVNAAKVDALSISAHKIYGPKGVGALYVRSKLRTRLVPLLHGGGHERGLRSGTLNVPAIVGFGEACRLAGVEMQSEASRLRKLRNQLRERLWSSLDGVSVNGSLERRLPGNLNVSFANIEAEALMMGLKDIALSSGSACTSASLEPSYVLLACGLSEEHAHGSVRFGIGRFNTDEEIAYVADVIVEKVRTLRGLRASSRR